MCLLIGAAIILQIIPLPHTVTYIRPDLVLLSLVYIALYKPMRVSLLCVWFLGLFIDLLLSTTLGIHAALYCLAVYVVLLFSKHMATWSFSQQATFMAILYLVYVTMLCLLSMLWGGLIFRSGYLFSVIPAVIYWFFLYCFFSSSGVYLTSF